MSDLKPGDLVTVRGYDGYYKIDKRSSWGLFSDGWDGLSKAELGDDNEPHYFVYRLNNEQRIIEKPLRKYLICIVEDKKIIDSFKDFYKEKFQQ